MFGIGFRVHAWCKSCRHAKDAPLAALIVAGRGDVPLVQMKWRCVNCSSGLTGFIVVGPTCGRDESPLLAPRTRVQLLACRNINELPLAGSVPNWTETRPVCMSA
jgi:hypothetical protein